MQRKIPYEPSERQDNSLDDLEHVDPLQKAHLLPSLHDFTRSLVVIFGVSIRPFKQSCSRLARQHSELDRHRDRVDLAARSNRLRTHDLKDLPQFFLDQVF
jgi:hypothetical protein